MKKALIEESTIELLELFDKVSEEAKKEKTAIPAINRMIYWWTRKPIIVGRAMILASTLDKIDDVKLFLGLNSSKRAYQYFPDKGKYREKLGIPPKQIKVLDPFGGAGSLAFSSAFLGLDVTISDYNPLAYLIERSVLEFPAKYGAKLATDFEKYAKRVIEKTKDEVGKFFKENQLSYLWYWCIKCPHCNQHFPLTNHMYIAKTKMKKIGIKIIPKNKDFMVDIIRNISSEEGKKFTQKGGSAICISCTNPVDYETMTTDIAKNKDRVIVAIQIQKNKGRDYVSPTLEDKKLYQEAVKFFESKRTEYEKENLIPKEDIRPSHQDTLGHYGIKNWDEYFDQRQLLVLATFLKNIQQVCKQIPDTDNRVIISLYLAAIMAKRVDMCGFGVRFNTVAEKPEGVLSMRRPSFIFNFAESNPFEYIGGSLLNIVKSISKSISFTTRLQNPSKCKLESVTTQSNKKYDLIITDPPYGDDVQYGELSEFFYVWVYRALKDFFPELPPRVSLNEDFCVSRVRFGNKKLAEEFFAKGLKKSFVSLSDKLKDDGLLVVFFAHSSTEAWNLFLQSIRAAKFRVVSSYSIHTEYAANILTLGKTSFMSSIVVTCRKITKESTQYFEDLIPQIEDKIKKMISKIPDEKILTLSITDLLIMVYGKVLEACTQHTTLKSYQKDFTPDFETLINDARSLIIKEIITKLTGRSLNMLGSPTAFYLLAKIFHHGILSSDDALKIARTYGIDIGILEKNNVAKKEAGIIRLLYLHENELNLKPEEIDRNNLHQQLCYLVQVTKKQGASKVPTILSYSKNFRIDDLKQIISLLIKSFRLQINKNEKLNDDEKEELQSLEGISDVMGIKTVTKTKGGLDQYFED